jgi:hypothetical protein
LKFGIVLPTWIYSRNRQFLADAAFASLAETQPATEKPYLLQLVKSGQSGYPTQALQKPFNCIVVPDPENVSGTEQTLAYGTQWILDETPADYVVWLGDDALFNPRWLIELEGLIGRHPEARAWSVYRSAYEQIHKTLVETESDAMVRSLCGHGMTFTREEWAAWGINWRQGKMWSNPHGGETLDLHHVWARPGERWATRRSYIDHTGKTGFHCQPQIPEYARDFISQ